MATARAAAPACASARFSSRSIAPRRIASVSARRALRRSAVGPVNMAATPGNSINAVADKLNGEDLENWESCSSIVMDLGFTEEETETFMQKAFGWKGQGYWRQSKEEEVPSPQDLQARLDFVEGLGIQGEDLAAYVKKFPEVLGLDVEGQMVPTVEDLQVKWFMKSTVLANALKRRPEVLGYNIDCQGDCAGECNRCWVRF